MFCRIRVCIATVLFFLTQMVTSNIFHYRCLQQLPSKRQTTCLWSEFLPLPTCAWPPPHKELLWLRYALNSVTTLCLVLTTRVHAFGFVRILSMFLLGCVLLQVVGPAVPTPQVVQAPHPIVRPGSQPRPQTPVAKTNAPNVATTTITRVSSVKWTSWFVGGGIFEKIITKHILFSPVPPSGDLGEREEMQELPGDADKAGLQWHPVPWHGQECPRACQESAGTKKNTHTFTTSHCHSKSKRPQLVH